MRKIQVILFFLSLVALTSALISIAIGPQWIEALIGFEPDGGSGSLEILLVLVPATIAALLGFAGYVVRRLEAKEMSATVGGDT